MTTLTQEHAADLAKQNLLYIFGERDESKRLAQMKETYATDIIFHDPGNTVQGHEAVNEVVSQLLDSNPEWRFRTVGRLWVNDDLVTLEWEFGPSMGDAPVRGNDIIFVDGEGKIAKMYTMIQGVSDAELPYAGDS